MGAGIPGIDAVVFINQRLMPTFLGTKGAGDIHRAIHHLSTLIVQAKDRLTLRNEGLLLHPRLGAQHSGYIVQIPHLIPLVDGEGYISFCQGRVFPHTRLKLKGVP